MRKESRIKGGEEGDTVQGGYKPIHEQIADLFYDLTCTYGKLNIYVLFLFIEGRDKVSKGLQYLAKFLSWYYQHTDPEKGIKYFQISGKPFLP